MEKGTKYYDIEYVRNNRNCQETSLTEIEVADRVKELKEDIEITDIEVFVR